MTLGRKKNFLAGQQTTRAPLKLIAKENFPGHHFWIYPALGPSLPLDQMNCPVGPKECWVGRDIKLGSLIGPRRPPFVRVEG